MRHSLDTQQGERENNKNLCTQKSKIISIEQHKAKIFHKKWDVNCKFCVAGLGIEDKDNQISICNY